MPAAVLLFRPNTRESPTSAPVLAFAPRPQAKKGLMLKAAMEALGRSSQLKTLAVASMTLGSRESRV